MNQEERSQRSRGQVLDAALKLFSHQGYRATSMRDIAAAARVSTGAVYHHFKEKEAIFKELLDQYWRAIDDPGFPVNWALTTGTFPENLEQIGYAARDSIAQYRDHVALIYVDVVEFEGSHIRKFYTDMAGRFERFVAAHRGELKLEGKLRDNVSAASAVMLAFRTFLQYFAVELVFGVPNHFGKSSEEVVHEISDILRHGVLRQPSKADDQTSLGVRQADPSGLSAARPVQADGEILDLGSRLRRNDEFRARVACFRKARSGSWSAGPVWQGATSENSGNTQARSIAARPGPRRGTRVGVIDGMPRPEVPLQVSGTGC
jgi:AcrR family transcriptional regulator